MPGTRSSSSLPTPTPFSTGARSPSMTVMRTAGFSAVTVKVARSELDIARSSRQFDGRLAGPVRTRYQIQPGRKRLLPRWAVQGMLVDLDELVVADHGAHGGIGV